MSDLGHMHHFLAVVEAGGFRPAARQLTVSPATLVRSVRILEDAYGVALIHREGRSQTLTAHGKQLLEEVRRILRLHEAIPATLRDVTNLVRGELRVGVSPVILDLCLDRAMASLLSRHPGVEITIEIGNANELADQLQSDRLDLIAAYTRPLKAQRALHVESLYEETTAWWVREDHPLTKTERLGIGVLADFPLLCQPLPFPYRTWLAGLERAITRDRGSPHPIRLALQCMDYALLSRVTATTDAIALIPIRNAVVSPAAGPLVRLALPLPPPAGQLGVAWAQDAPESPLRSTFVSILQEVTRSTAGPAG